MKYLVKVSGKASSWIHISELTKQLYHAPKPHTCHSCYPHYNTFTAFCCWILIPPLRLSETSPSSGKSSLTFPGWADPSLLGDSVAPYKPLWQPLSQPSAPLFSGPHATVLLDGTHHLRGVRIEEEAVPALPQSYFRTDPLFFVTPASQNYSLFHMDIYRLHKTGS